jgi:exopolysaccharide biosynthesis polyprenyl glycosylphosphotransferase
VPVLIGGAKLTGLYDRDESLLHKTTLDEAPKLFQLATLCALGVWLLDGHIVIGQHSLSRHEALLLWLALAAMLVVSRSLARCLARLLTPPERCLLIGDEDSARAVRARLGCHGGVKAEWVAHVQFDRAGHWATDSYSGPGLEHIRELARTLDVQRAIIAPSWDDSQRRQLLDLVRTLKAAGMRVSLVPRMLEAVGSSVEFDDLHGMTVMGVRSFDLTRSSSTVKRMFDLTLTTVGLVVVSPLMLAIAIAIKLDSRGAVLFHQQRVGWRGLHFTMLKFRTMVPDAEGLKDSLRAQSDATDGLFKLREDPRVTRVGRVLRATSLDELPQLFNVLRGEMSLVGPRPLVLEEDSMISGWDRRRLELMPGMTGPWQIVGPTRAPLREMMAIDYLYVANWSLWTDIKLLLRTAGHVARRRGM